MLRFVLAFVALSSRQLEGDDHDDHDHGHAHSASEEEMLKLPLCGCLAAEKGFKIDCSDSAAVTKAYEAVVECSKTDCKEAECLKNWAIVETHHDLCLHDEIAKEVEVGFHDLEEAGCPHTCLVGRKTGGLADCAPAQCDKAKELTAAMKLGDCTKTCTADCGADYAVLRALHDTCDDGTLDMDMEKILHDVEESCEEYNCWAESSHCDGITGANVDLVLDDLKERAFDKCKFTEEDAKLCPGAGGGSSGAYAAVFLAYFLA